jgi:hypothetical protein
MLHSSNKKAGMGPLLGSFLTATTVLPSKRDRRAATTWVILQAMNGRRRNRVAVRPNHQGGQVRLSVPAGETSEPTKQERNSQDGYRG